MAKRRSKRGTDQDAAFIDRFVFKLSSRLALTLVVVVVFLTLVQ